MQILVNKPRIYWKIIKICDPKIAIFCKEMIATIAP